MGTYILNKYQAPIFKIDPKKYNVMIRITNPGEDLLPLQNSNLFRDVLEIRFYDFDKEQNGLQIFDDHHADILLDFFQKHTNCENMIIHCDIGISRSAGVAVGWFLFKDSRSSIHKIYHDSKHLPNKLVVKSFARRLKKDMKYIEKWEKEKFENLTKNEI
jgi:predicted protein tyrosine phosphatase